MNTLTPIEAALWSTGVAIQANLALKVFGGVLFTGFVVLFFTRYCHQALSSLGSKSDSIEILKTLGKYGFIVLLGLSFTRTVSLQSFSPVDSGDRKWSDYVQVSSHPKYESLQSSKDGLYWYLILQKGAVELSEYVTSAVTELFNDPDYKKSPEMLFKILVNTASITLDDPAVTVKLDQLMNKCSDTKRAKIVDENESLFAFLDLENPECMGDYRDVQQELKVWSERKIPTYLRKTVSQPNNSVSWAVQKFNDKEAIQNKIIASALVSYAKDKVRSDKDAINTNRKALGITNNEDYAWFTVQRALTGGSMPAIFANWFGEEGEIEGSINRNEARIVYNNLYNLIPSFRGYVKLFLAIAFVLASAALSLGFIKPMLVWLSALIMDAGFLPISALNYEIHALLMSSGDIGAKFSHLSNDPMVLMGAAAIDSQLVFYQTTYFLVQFVIAAMMVVGVIYSGFAVNKMSFAQGVGFGGALGAMGGHRLLSSMATRVGHGAVNKAGQVTSAVIGRVRGRPLK